MQTLETKSEAGAKGIAVQADDRVVIGGGEAPDRLVLIRFLPNGEPDPSFGLGGRVTTPFPGGFGEARAVAIQPDGKIVAAGSAKGAVDGDFLIARYNADGSPDLGFGGGDGRTVLPVGDGFDEAEDVAIAADGRIVAVGRSELAKEDVAGVVVLLANGAPDPEFSADGVATVQTPGGHDEGVAIEALPDGRILFADQHTVGIGAGFSLVQLLANANFDPSFGGGDGIVLAPVPSGDPGDERGQMTDFARLGDGRIVAAGYGFEEVGSPPEKEGKVAAARFMPNGDLDPGFGEGGFFTKQLPGNSYAGSVSVDSAGRVLLGGEYEDPASNEQSPAVIRLLADGALDPAYGSGGVVLRGVTAPFGELFENAALDSLDRLLTLDTAYLGNNVTASRVSRYQGDPRPQPQPANRPPHARMKRVPRKLPAKRLGGFSGTASDPDGDAIGSVQVALVRLLPHGARASRRAAPACLVLKNARGRFKRARPKRGKRCPQRWLTARGTAKWSFRLKRRLPPGRYVVYARAVDSAGLAESSFTRNAGNRFAFRALPPRRRHSEKPRRPRGARGSPSKAAS